MNLKKIFERGRVLKIASEQLKLHEELLEERIEIIWTDCRIRKLIREWTMYGLWSMSDFKYCLESAAVEMPITFDDFDEERESFKCITADDKELEIFLSYEHDYGFYLKEVTYDKSEIRKYNVTINSKLEEKVPIVELQGKTIYKNGRELKCSYDRFICQCKLIDSKYELVISISEPNAFQPSECKLSTNFDVVEEYLINLGNLLKVEQLYTELIKLLNFSVEDIRMCDEFMISYEEKIREYDNKVLARIRKCRGKIKEYAFQKNGGIYYMCKNGICSYVKDGIIVSYIKNEDTISVDLTDYKDKKIEEINFQNLIKGIVAGIKVYSKILV